VRHIHLYSLVDRRKRRKLAAGQSLRRRLSRLMVGCVALALVGLVAVTLFASLAYASLVDGMPSLDALPRLLNPVDGLLMQPTRMYDRSGQILLHSLENPGIPRRYLSINQQDGDHFSVDLIRLTVGLLDPGFWHSPGIDLRRPLDPSPETIAERLVNDLLLDQEPPGLRRTLRMRILAAQVVAQYGHAQVLEWYMNSAFFGHLAYGADSAARLYLGKPASQLGLAEAALLLSANQAPALNPLDAPQAALGIQRVILDLLLSRGIISTKEHSLAAASPLHLAEASGPEASAAAAFSRLVVDRLAANLGRERIERGGLHIITTLDYELQLELTCLARTQLARLTARPGRQQVDVRLPDGRTCQSVRLLPTLSANNPALPLELTTSAVVLDPQTGQVLAMIGDTTSQGESIYLSQHAPGSLLTPFAAVAGFARGAGPATLAWDIPSSLPEDLSGRSNPDGVFHGPVRLRIALANDYLAPVTKMINQIGAENVWRLASAMGLTSLANANTEDLLYAGGAVSPLELAQGYAVLAAQGMRTGQRLNPAGDPQLILVLHVEDQEGIPVPITRQTESQPVVSPQLSYMVHNVLSDSAARWPSLGYPNPLDIGRPAGAKIGQVDGAQQVWTAGYTRDRVAVFWLGLPEGSGQELNPRMAAGMWHALMQYSNRDLPIRDWPEPAGITRLEVCDPSGQRPTPVCPETVREVFLAGNEPNAPDTLYRQYQINRETGRLATVFTPVELIETKTYLVAPPLAAAWAQAAGLPLPPEDYDAIQPPDPSPFVRITSPGLFTFARGQVQFRGTAAGPGFRFYQLLVGQGINPQTWLQVGPDGTQPVTDSVLGTWDTQGPEGLYTIRLLVVRDNQQVEIATIQLTVDNSPPTVRIPYPLSNQEFDFAANQKIIFQADASDTIAVSKLVWLVNGREVGETAQPPYIFSWPLVRGEHVLEVRAYDLAGNEGLSEQIRFRVR
jgi:membrane peptidoglycan carboxypeptidase